MYVSVCACVCMCLYERVRLTCVSVKDPHTRIACTYNHTQAQCKNRNVVQYKSRAVEKTYLRAHLHIRNLAVCRICLCLLMCRAIIECAGCRPRLASLLRTATCSRHGTRLAASKSSQQTSQDFKAGIWTNGWISEIHDVRTS